MSICLTLVVPMIISWNQVILPHEWKLEKTAPPTREEPRAFEHARHVSVSCRGWNNIFLYKKSNKLKKIQVLNH